MRVEIVKACHVTCLEVRIHICLNRNHAPIRPVTLRPEGLPVFFWLPWEGLQEAHTEVGDPCPRLRLSLWLERDYLCAPENLAVLDFGLGSDRPGWILSYGPKWDRWPWWEQVGTNECGQFVKINWNTVTFFEIHRNQCYLLHILHNPPIKNTCC